MEMKRKLQENQYYPESTELFTILRFLGEGRTAYVYHAIDFRGKHLALKIMHPDLNDDMRRMFRGEKNNLLQLYSDLSSYGENLTPRLYTDYDLPEEQSDQFIAQELVPGKQIVEMVETGQPFDEEIGTIILEKFALVLQVLHEDMKKTYSDMKYQNLWWIEDEKSIRVTDWNVIDDYSDATKQRDLLKFATYAARILVGQMPLTQGNLIIEDIKENPNWENISYGAQNFLRKALHTNPKHRYETASQMRSDLQALTKAWAWERVGLVSALSDTLDTAEAMSAELPQIGDEKEKKKKRHQALALFEKAKAFLEIADRQAAAKKYRLRSSDRDEYAWRIKQGIDTINFITIGLEFYASTDYKRASESFAKGYEKGGGEKAWRWYALGEMAIAVGEDFGEIAHTMKEAVENLNNGDHSEAVRRFNNVALKNHKLTAYNDLLEGTDADLKTRFDEDKNGKYNKDFSLLYVEALAWERLHLANNRFGNEDYDRARSLYAQASSLFDLLPAELKILVPSDLTAQYKEAERLSLLDNISTNEAEEEVIQGHINAARQLYENIYKEIVKNIDAPAIDPSSEVLAVLWQSIAQKGQYLLSRENYEGAKDLFRLGLSRYPDNAEFRLGVWQAEQLIRITSTSVVNHPLKGFESLYDLLGYARDFSSLTVLKAVVSERLDTVLDQLTDLGEHVLAQRLVDRVKKADEKWWQDEVKGRYLQKIQVKQNQLDENIRKFIGEMRREANRLAQQPVSRTDLDRDRVALDEKISRTRGWVAQLPISTPSEGYLKDIRDIERGFIRSLPKSKAEIQEDVDVLRAAQDKLKEVNGLLNLISQKTLHVSYAVWGNSPVRWYKAIDEIKNLTDTASNWISETRTDLAAEFAKLNNPANLLYLKLKEIDDQLAEKEAQLNDIAEERRNREREKLHTFIGETHQLIQKEKYADAARMLTRIEPLVEKQPGLKKEFHAVERKYRQSTKERFIPKSSFWILQSIIFFVLIALTSFSLIFKPRMDSTKAMQTATVRMGIENERATMVAATATVIRLEAYQTATQAAVNMEATRAFLQADADVVAAATASRISELERAASCDNENSSLVYVGGDASPVDIEKGIYNLVWRYQNQSGCLLADFSAVNLRDVDISSTSLLPNYLAYSDILEVEYTGAIAFDKPFSAPLAYSLNNSPRERELEPVTFTEVGQIMPVPAQGAILLPALYAAQGVLGPVVTSVNPAVVDAEGNIVSYTAMVEWIITNNSRTSIYIKDLLRPLSVWESDSVADSAKLISSIQGTLPFGYHFMEIGDVVRIQQRIEFSPDIVLKRVLIVNDGINDIEIYLAMDHDLTQYIPK